MLSTLAVLLMAAGVALVLYWAGLRVGLALGDGHPVGQWRWVIAIAACVLECFFGASVWRRIMRRRHGVERARGMLAAIVESSNDAIISEGLDGTILSWNAGAERLFGYSAGDAIGRPVAMLIPPGQAPLVPEYLEEIKTGGTLRRHAVERVRKDGSRIYVSLSISPIWDAAGQVIGVAKIAHDITDVKQAEDQLKAAICSADAAKAAAELANQAKDNFLAVLSHELRTPLTPVLTTASLMEKDARLPVDCRQDAQLIRRNVELEARLIDDLLDITRIAQGKVELNLRPVELCQIIHRSIEVCTPDIQTKRLKFQCSAGSGATGMVMADAVRLQQVFWNLIRNAVKFTPADGWVRIWCRCDDNGWASVEVSDSGEGIDPGVLPRIFNPFEQGGRGMTRQFGGLGLGLTICRALVEKHGGTIGASSGGKGQGATFLVKLPLLTAAGPGREEMPAKTEAGSAKAAASKPLNILLVEDHADTALIMRRLLKMNGHDVETAGDVAAALTLAEARRFDLLISDIGLPDGSGVDLLRTLRFRGCHMPGIALSGYGQEEDIRHSKEAGFSSHLIKPANLDMLAQAIAAVVACERLDADVMG